MLGNYILSYDIVKYWSIISLGFVPKLELVILLSELKFLVLYSLFAIKVYKDSCKIQKLHSLKLTQYSLLMVSKLYMELELSSSLIWNLLTI